MKRLVILVSVLLLVGGMLFAAPAIKNPDTLIMLAPGDVVTLDPAVAYDNVSWSMLGVLYDRLVDYKGADLGTFVPSLATAVPTVANGGISKDGRTYTFTIRGGVKFANGYALTAEDVVYTFQRDMITDPDSGPAWVWYSVILGSGTQSRDENGNLAVNFADIQKAIRAQGNKVIFTLKNPYPAFLSVLAGKWGSIVSKKWLIEQGGWDGTAATIAKYNNPPTSKETLFNVAMGTGPYKLQQWLKGVEIDVTRNDSYWGKKPALKNGVYKVVDEQATRKLQLLQGDADIIYVPATNFPEMQNEKGIKIYKNLASLDLTGAHFNLNINTQANSAVYSGKLDGEGIPADFFADKNVRLGFIYAWDEEMEIRDGFNGNSMDPVTFIPKGLPFKNEKLKSKPHDMEKAKAAFQKAFNGEVWQKGFKFDILYNSGNLERETAAKILAENVMALNPKFQVGVRALEWSQYSDENKNKRVPILFMGWAPDYPDPDDYAQPYMSSTGYFAGRQSYNNPKADELVAKAGVELDKTKRQQYYSQLQDIWLDDAIAIIFNQPLRQRFVKDWVKGYYYSPMESQEFELLPILSKTYSN
ncbi:MAG TPA: ABC transporter substrate-binding protein [Spirochaetia bacterium]